MKFEWDMLPSGINTLTLHFFSEIDAALNTEYIHRLTTAFETNAHPDNAKGQRQYMKNRFDFYGLSTNVRRSIQKPFLDKNHLPTKAAAKEMIQMLWEKPQREYQYFAQELAQKYLKTLTPDDILLYEHMVTHQSWWDTVDVIAVHLMGRYFRTYPDQIAIYIPKWLSSGNMWLQRSAILFQLQYKQATDTVLLQSTIESMLGSKEFFINKAIGWALREYSKTNPEWVKHFAHTTPLSNLSKREALKVLLRKNEGF